MIQLAHLLAVLKQHKAGYQPITIGRNEFSSQEVSNMTCELITAINYEAENKQLKERLARYEGDDKFSVTWCVEDVKGQCKYLTDEQAAEVLGALEKHHDCNNGITWVGIEATAWSLFPPPKDEGDE